jgi:hypothetical protein
MTLPDLAEALDAIGVSLSARLVVDAPEGAMTPDLRAALAEHKVLILQRVVREMTWSDLARKRWGNQLADPTPDIDIFRPDRDRMLAAVEALQGQRGDADETRLEAYPRFDARADSEP